MYLNHHTFLPCVTVSHLGDAVTRSTNLQEGLCLNIALRRRDHQLRFFEIPGRTTRKVSLMLLSLGVCEGGAFIGVEGETETTFEGTKVVAQDIGILSTR